MMDIIKLAEQHGATHKQNLNVYQFFPDELNNYTNAVIEECVMVLMDMHDKANGQHNYYKHAAITLKERLK